MPDELEPYDVELPIDVEYIRKPIRDHSVPARREHMVDIQACLEHAMRTGQPHVRALPRRHRPHRHGDRLLSRRAAACPASRRSMS